jgi:hypothetical protein
MRYISFSYSDEITTRDNNKMAMLIQSPGYRQLWGDRFIMAKTGERRLVNDKTGFKLATSVGGVSTGERGRISIGPIMAAAGEQANGLAVPTHDQPIAVVLDLVHPVGP